MTDSELSVSLSPHNFNYFINYWFQRSINQQNPIQHSPLESEWVHQTVHPVHRNDQSSGPHQPFFHSTQRSQTSSTRVALHIVDPKGGAGSHLGSGGCCSHVADAVCQIEWIISRSSPTLREAARRMRTATDDDDDDNVRIRRWAKCTNATNTHLECKYARLSHVAQD